MSKTSCPKRIAVLLALLALGPGAALAKTGLDLRADVGHDSNVFKLNDSIGERSGRFTDFEAGFEAESGTGSGWTTGLGLGAQTRRYESSVSDGDEHSFFARLHGDSGRKTSGHGFDWALRYRMRDSTFVSRLTGAVATDDGTPTGAPIGDRFDNATADLRGAWHLPKSDRGRVSLEGSFESTNYREDYDALGLDRLDYNQFGVEPRYQGGAGADSFRIGLPLALRQYRDRRVSDETGAAVPGSDLEYTYYGVDARYEHEFSRANALEVDAGYEIRTDNGVGYRDRRRWNAGAEWVCRPADKTRLSAGMEWSSRVFDRPNDPALTGDDPEKEGYTLDLRFVTPFPGVQTRDLSVLGSVQWQSFDNSGNALFSYDRLEAFAGVRKRF